MAELLFPKMPEIYKKIDEENFFAIDVDKLLNIKNNKFNESTLRLVMFAYDIIISRSKNIFILRRRYIAKDKTPFYWKKAVRKLRIYIKLKEKNTKR